METRKHCKVILSGSLSSKCAFITPLVHLDEKVDKTVKKGCGTDGVPTLYVTVDDNDFRIWDWELIKSFPLKWRHNDAISVVILYLEGNTTAVKTTTEGEIILHFQAMDCTPLECLKRIIYMNDIEQSIKSEIKTSMYHSSTSVLFPAKEGKVEGESERALRKSC